MPISKIQLIIWWNTIKFCENICDNNYRYNWQLEFIINNNGSTINSEEQIVQARNNSRRRYLGIEMSRLSDIQEIRCKLIFN